MIKMLFILFVCSLLLISCTMNDKYKDWPISDRPKLDGFFIKEVPFADEDGNGKYIGVGKRTYLPGFD